MVAQLDHAVLGTLAQMAGTLDEIRRLLDDDNPRGLVPYRDTVVDNTLQMAVAARLHLYGWHIYNPGASDAFLQVYDSVGASIGVTVPRFTLWVPAGGALDDFLARGIRFDNALAYAATAAYDASSAAPASPLEATFFYV